MSVILVQNLPRHRFFNHFGLRLALRGTIQSLERLNPDFGKSRVEKNKIEIRI